MSPKKTRKNRSKEPHIEHHHLLMRIETAVCPLQEDKDRMEKMIHEIVSDVDMKPLGSTAVYYVAEPKYNEGLTAVQVIQTSHIAFHFWRRPDRNILKNKRSNCLLQMDVYTCGRLTKRQIGIILNALARFDPMHADITLLNRKWSLNVESHDRWSSGSGNSSSNESGSNDSWAQWVLKRFA